MIWTCIQARMDSQRFPGKVLAPFRGKPLIHAVIESVKKAASCVAVLTSHTQSDDPLCAYLSRYEPSVMVFRGSAENVAARFAAFLQHHPCEYFFRLCGDSPLLSPAVISTVHHQQEHAAGDSVDMFTTVWPRSTPHGQSVELINTKTFLAQHIEDWTADEKEHVTSYFYRCSARFKIVSVPSSIQFPCEDMAVDTIDDLRRLEALPWSPWSPFE